MAFKIAPDSHVDHNLTAEQISWLKNNFQERDGFFVESVLLPETLGIVPCGLHGPLMGDEPVADSDVTLERRGEREYRSRTVDRPTRPTRTVTVIAGPHEKDTCILYTAFGGPVAPKEPGDESLGDDERAESEEFWSKHALSAG